MKKLLFSTTVLALVLFSQSTIAQDKMVDKKMTDKTMKDKMMSDNLDIVGVAAANKDFSTLVAAVKAAGLVDALKGEGPFTVFAPNNAAFEKLPKETVATLLKPENKATLTAILTYHVVSGKFMAADVVKAIKDNNGSFKVKTLQGEELKASISGSDVILTDAKGNTSKVIATDVKASNGVIHGIDSVVMPK